MIQTGPAIELRGLTKRFGKVTAVEGLSLEVPRGTTLGLLGPNGAGKSTTLKMLLGMLRPTSGSVSVCGVCMLSSPSVAKQKIGFVPEVHHIYRWMTVAQVLRFASAMYVDWNDERSDDLLARFQLPLRRRVGGLSKGMLGKLSLVIALAHEPDVLVLDEPLAGLDLIARDEFIESVLQEQVGESRTVVFSSHQLDEVARLADSIAIIHSGRILTHRSLDDLNHNVFRITATLLDGRLPVRAPEGTIWQKINRREWLLTVDSYSPELLDWIREQNPVQHIDARAISLDQAFKDFILGQAAT